MSKSKADVPAIRDAIKYEFRFGEQVRVQIFKFKTFLKKYVGNSFVFSTPAWP